MPPPPQPAEVERVDRPAALEHHVVGDVDDVADRAHARRAAAGRCIHAGDGPIVHAGRGRVRDEARAQVSASTTSTRGRLDRRRVDRRPCATGSENGRPKARRGRARPRRCPWRRAGWRDREVEDDVVEAEHLASVVPSAARSAGSTRMPGVVVAEAELGGRAQHAFGPLAPDLAPLDLEAARQVRAERWRTARPRRPRCWGRRTRRRRAAPSPGVDVGELDLVGVGMRRDVEDLGRRRRRRSRRRRARRPRPRGRGGQAPTPRRRRRPSSGREVTDPGERERASDVLRTASRKRTSSSNRV